MSKPDLSCFSGYFSKSLTERRDILNKFNHSQNYAFNEMNNHLLMDNETLSKILDGNLSHNSANTMVENQIGLLQIPIGICPYMYVNGKHYIVPMATEEPSVIAAASSLSKIAFEHGLPMNLDNTMKNTTENNNQNNLDEEIYPKNENQYNGRGGFTTFSSKNIMTAQIQLLVSKNGQINTNDKPNEYNHVFELIKNKLNDENEIIIKESNKFCENMVKRGGGVVQMKVGLVHPKPYDLSISQAMKMYLEEMSQEVEFNANSENENPPQEREKKHENSGSLDHSTSHNFNHDHYSSQPSICVYIDVDVCDSMGANLLNTIAEGLAPFLVKLASETVDSNQYTVTSGLRILSNLSLNRYVKCGLKIPVSALTWKHASGLEVSEGIVSAWRFARDDPMRACTHNKGIMNGISAVALATGQDTRAIEASLHTYAGSVGRYQPLTHYTIKDDHLECIFEGPISVGTRGGSIGKHPTFSYALSQMGWPSAQELAGVMGCIGLAQNLAALRALAIEGIQKGHMSLHNRSS